MKMQRQQKNTAWTEIVYGRITTCAANERRNYGQTVYRLVADGAGNTTLQAKLDAGQLLPRREYRTLAACKKSAEKLGWTAQK